MGSFFLHLLLIIGNCPYLSYLSYLSWLIAEARIHAKKSIVK